MEELDIDLTKEDVIPTPIQKTKSKGKKPVYDTTKIEFNEDELTSCLRNEVIIVRFIKRSTGLVQNPKHLLFGGLAETAKRTFSVPLLTTGTLKNVLTNDEKDFLEQYMGLPSNSLSVYNKVDNYWKDLLISLGKEDTYLNLSDANDYIKYKVLLANTDTIAPTWEAYLSYPKMSYQYVLVGEDDMTNSEKGAMDLGMKATELFAKIMNNKQALRVVLEIMEGKAISASTKLDYLKGQVYKQSTTNPKLFVKLVDDPFLDTRVLIRNAVDASLIRRRGDFYFLAKDNSPLCRANEDPTLPNAILYLNNPAKQAIKFTLEAELKALEE